ncbi:hypothetical protein H5410_021349 [Solanum commersonii]|uniref:Uncharacterized protein n=1 Tax=Solanum commersonii TaxID=4109 RepID=A0A9J5ZEW4_SOLCO|nr:hypothetical protein H5410_021349 [Solanum commersonii]
MQVYKGHEIVYIFKKDIFLLFVYFNVNINSQLNVFQLLLEGQIRILKSLGKTLWSCSNISMTVALFGLMLDQSVLNRRVDTRVDEMVNAGSFCSYFIYESIYNNDSN